MSINGAGVNSLAGPLNKSLYTQQLELIAKCLIYLGPENIKICSSLDQKADRSIFTLEIGNQRIILSDLFQKVNFAHLYMNEEDSRNYLSNYKLFTLEAIKKEHPNLTEAEKRAINEYSACSDNFNFMLYGNKHLKLTKQILLDCIFLASGLNKLPQCTEYNLPEAREKAILPSLRTYRGEVYMTEEIINQRKECIVQGGGVTKQGGFLSTSSSRKISKGFSKNSLILLEHFYGKDISKLANDPKEKEFLLTPCKIAWYDFKKEGELNKFYGRVVAPLNEKEEETSEEAIAMFKRLLTWAQGEGINIDFLTGHLKQILQSTSFPLLTQNPMHPVRSNTSFFGSNFIKRMRNTWFNKVNSLVLSKHFYKTLCLVGVLGVVGSDLFLQSIIFPLSLSLMGSSITSFFGSNFIKRMRNTWFNKVNSLVLSKHFYKTLCLVGVLGVVGSYLFLQGIIFPLSLSLMGSSIFLAALIIRNEVYRKCSEQQSNSNFSKAPLTPQKKAFENGCKAAHAWFPYFQSQLVPNNWIHINAFAAGYYEELSRVQNGFKTPSL